MITLIIGYYIIINIVLFVLMFIDKKRAVDNKWRIKEDTLFKVALAGGFLGGLAGMKIFRHKTKKIKFHVIYIGSMVLHILLNYFIFFKN